MSRPTRNGKRHPQAYSCSGASPRVMITPDSAPSNVANPCPTICSEPNKPRRWGGAHSTRKLVALENSPPVAKPCSNRANTISIGAPIPIDTYVGANATMATAIVMRRMTNCKAALRPARSAYIPRTTAPTGRMKKPTPKVANVSSNAAYSLDAGKNRRAMITLTKPKTTKSYHSNALPITAAATCCARGIRAHGLLLWNQHHSNTPRLNRSTNRQRSLRIL